MKGSCLCGKIRFSAAGRPEGAVACHCTQCRKQSGHVWASARVKFSEFRVEGSPRWFAASDTARRGFCPDCGSFLFWKSVAGDWISFSLGAVDGPTELRLEQHIFTADKGDYYEITDGLPQS